MIYNELDIIFIFSLLLPKTVIIYIRDKGDTYG